MNGMILDLGGGWNFAIQICAPVWENDRMKMKSSIGSQPLTIGRRCSLRYPVENVKSIRLNQKWWNSLKMEAKAIAQVFLQSISMNLRLRQKKEIRLN